MKNRNGLAGIIIVQVVLCIFLTKSYALDPQTHRALNKYIANNTIAGFSLDTYLRGQLGLQNGKDEIFDSQEVWEWVTDGGEHEDKSIRFIKSKLFLPQLSFFSLFLCPVQYDNGWEKSFLI